MHNKYFIKLFKPFPVIILLYLLWIFQLTPAWSQERPSAAGNHYLSAEYFSEILLVAEHENTANNPYPGDDAPAPDRNPVIQQERVPEIDTLTPDINPVIQQERVPEIDTLTPDMNPVIHQERIPEIDTLDTETGLPHALQDPLQPPRRQNNFLTSQVEYHSADSMDFDVNQQKLFLYGEAWVKYETIELRADYIEIDLVAKEVFARGMTDSEGNVTGRPVMTDAGETFEAETMRYNFETERGITSGIITEQEGGFLHGHTAKKHENDHLHIQGGKYTTCDHEHPHYYIALTRAKVIPNDKVISGPAYLVIEDIPLPLILPFGFFPNKRGQTSGILFPTYGEEASRGFYLRGMGYYLNLNEYMSLQLRGDVYSLGSWAFNANSDYRLRYRFNGSFGFSYSHNVTGERGMANFSENTSYNLTWSHRQDPKASPYNNFSASVNFGSSQFNRYNTIDPDRFARNTAQSSVSFSRRWPDSPFSFNSGVRANQNFADQTVNLSLPSATFTMARQYPFRNANRVESRWYDNIEISYSSKMDNTLRTYDSLLFTSQGLRDLRSGFQHSIPLRANFRALNLINITPALTYEGVLYRNSISKSWVEDYFDPVRQEIRPSLVTDTIPGLVYGHALTPSFSTGLSQNIYGMFQFRNSRVEAIRHVMTPTIGFSYVPDLAGLVPEYYRTVETDDPNRPHTYSIFEGQMYGTPTTRGRSGNISFGLANNIEMKVRSNNDTIDQSRKVKIIDRLNFGTSYNIYADSMNWSPVSMTANTSLFENKVRLNFNASLDPYALDENLNRHNASQWSVNRRPGRITRAGFSLTTDFRSAAGLRRNGNGQAPIPGQPEMDPGMDPDMLPGDDIFGHLDDIDHTVHYYGDYVDFDVPWNLNIRYNLTYSNPRGVSQVNQTVNFSGSMSLTPRWQIQFSSGYDFRAGDFTMTNISVHRDLHCWDMRFGVVPFGSRKSWNFSIQVRSSILKDLKYHAQKSWYDNFFR